MAEAHDHDHDHTHGAGHDHGHAHGALTLEERHAHEAETYDAMAADLLASWADEDYRVDPESIPFANREHVDFLTDAIAEFGELKGKRILEVGAGGGSLSVWLALQGAEVVGIDVSSGILDVATKRAELNGVADQVHFVNAPIEHFEPAEHDLPVTFDGIIGNNVVHHFDRDLALSRIGQLLAPGAVAVFCEPILFVPEWMRSVRNSDLVTRRFPMHTHSPDERSLGEEDFVTMRRWFRFVDWRPYQLACRLQNFVELDDTSWNRLERFDRAALRRFRSLRRVARFAVITLSGPLEGNPR